MTQMTLASLGVFVSRPHSIRPLFWYADARSAFGTGSTVFITNIVNWFLNNLDRILIGRLLSTQAVGLYTAGYNLATMPNALLLGSLQPAFLSAGARLQTDHARLGQAYLKILATIAVLILPFFVFLSMIAPDLIRFLYGTEWAETGWVLSILFIAMPAYVAWGLSTPVLWNTGKKHYEALLQIPILLLGASGFYYFASNGLRYAAAIAAALLFLRAAVIMHFALRAVECNFLMLIPSIARGGILSLLAAASAYFAQQVVAPYDNAFLSLAASGLTALVVVAGTILIKPSILGEHAREILLRFAPKLTKVLYK
jgi:O-antigen/teichoic acid export membrane protein